jgi:MFS family permease
MDASRKKLYLLCGSVLPLMICTGIVYSIFSIYLHEEMGFSLSTIGVLFGLGAGTGAILSPFIGKASDRFGRKPVLIISSCAFLAVFTAYAFMTQLWQFVLIMMTEGISWIAIGTAAMAYIADISPRVERGQSYGVYEATWNVGWVVGPISGGFLADVLGFQNTFLIGASIILMSVIMVTIVLEETAGKKIIKIERAIA